MKPLRSFIATLLLLIPGLLIAQPAPVNYALAANGGTAISLSGEYSSQYVASGAINGDRKGVNWGGNGGWADNTPGVFPDTLQINFNGSKWINEIDVFTSQDYGTGTPVDPTPDMTFTQWGVTSFDLKYLDATGNYQLIPGAHITGNNKVWRKITFPAIQTSSVLVVVNGAADGYSRIVELEAWGPPSNQKNVALSSNGGSAISLAGNTARRMLRPAQTTGTAKG